MIQIEQFESGHYEQSVGYKYFVPNHVNDEWTWTDSTINHKKIENKPIKLLQYSYINGKLTLVDITE